jgi:hypothetical protein
MWTALRRVGQRFGPYLLVELLLPGGSLVALALFLYREGKLGRSADLTAIARKFRRAVTDLFGKRMLVLQPYILWYPATPAKVRSGR